MRAWVIRGTGGLDQLQPADVPDLAGPLEARQVRIALRAAALNHLDLFVVRGLPHEYRYPHILGADGAGVVEAVGAQVRSVRPGERVMINPGIPDYSCVYCRAGEHSLCLNYGILGEHLPGTLAPAIVVPEQNVAVIPTLPTPLTWAEAAAFSLVTLTAWRMIVTRAQVRRGETVLVWGIGGGVSLAALKIAKLKGARVIVTSSSDAKLREAQELGADVTLNHTTQKISQEVRALTDKRGADVVIDHVGEATWDESLRIARSCAYSARASCDRPSIGCSRSLRRARRSSGWSGANSSGRLRLRSLQPEGWARRSAILKDTPAR